MIRAIGLSSAMSKMRNLQVEVPKAARSAVRFAHHEPKLRAIAQAVIYMNVTLKEEVLIPIMLRTLMGRDTALGFVAQMSGDRQSDDPMFVELEPEYAIRSLPDELILEWVRLFKDKDERDVYSDGTPMSDEDIALRVRSAIQAHPEQWTKNLDDPRGLWRFAGFGGLGVNSERASAILAAILHAWSDYIHVSAIPKVQAEIRRVL